MKSIFSTIIQHQDWLRKAAIGILLLAITGQFLFFVKVSADNSYDAGLIAAFDNDSANAVKVLNRTRIWNDNSWDIYGPSYYRISKYLERAINLTGTSVDKASLPYLYLQVTSVIALFALSYLMAWLLSSSLFYQLLMTPFFVWSFTQDYTWLFVIYRAHPDLLFALLVGIAAHFSSQTILKATTPEKESNWKLAAIFWGLCGLTKLTTILFLPSLIFPVLSFAKEERLKRFKQFAAWAFGSYALFGFPQSFDLGPFFFLKRQSKHIETATLGSMAEWVELFYAQGYWPVLFTVAFAFLIPMRRRIVNVSSLDRKQLGMVLGLLALPVLVLFTRKVNSPHDWYPMPFLMLILLGLILFLPSFTGLLENSSGFIRRSLAKPGLLFVIAVLLPFALPAMDMRNPEILFSTQRCFEEAQETKKFIDKEIEQGGKAVVTSFVPFSFRHNPDRQPKATRKVDAHYRPTFDLINSSEANFLVLNRRYYQSYFNNAQKYSYLKTLGQTQKFFSAFEEGDEFTDPNGTAWVKSESFCDYVVWRKKQESSEE